MKTLNSRAGVTMVLAVISIHELLFFYLHSNISWKWKVFEKVFEILYFPIYLFLNTFVFKSIWVTQEYLYLNTFQCIWPHVWKGYCPPFLCSSSLMLVTICFLPVMMFNVFYFTNQYLPPPTSSQSSVTIAWIAFITKWEPTINKIVIVLQEQLHYPHQAKYRVQTHTKNARVKSCFVLAIFQPNYTLVWLVDLLE